MMIGAMHISHDGQTIRIELDEQMTWNCSDEQLRRYLTEVFPMNDLRQARASMLRTRMMQIAERLGATVIDSKTKPAALVH
jgi:hypothetical protein